MGALLNSPAFLALLLLGALFFVGLYVVIRLATRPRRERPRTPNSPPPADL